jgi:hypothetical protein
MGQFQKFNTENEDLTPLKYDQNMFAQNKQQLFLIFDQLERVFFFIIY